MLCWFFVVFLIVLYGCRLWAVTLWLSFNLVLAMVALVSSMGVFSSLSTHEGVPFYDKTKPKGSRYNDDAFKIQPRLALHKLWWWYRFILLTLGMHNAGFALAFKIIGEDVTFYSHGEFVADFVDGISWIVCGLDDERKEPSHHHGVFDGLSMEGEALEASAIASMLGDADAPHQP